MKPANLSSVKELMPTLFDNTSRNAGKVAARMAPSRYHKIMCLLDECGNLAIWQIAEKLKVFDHQISGRFSELTREGLIMYAGRRVIKPGTQCEAETYTLTQLGRDFVNRERELNHPLSTARDTEGTETDTESPKANFWKGGI
jgi:predicted ArsR family transcriptional regulator